MFIKKGVRPSIYYLGQMGGNCMASNGEKPDYPTVFRTVNIKNRVVGLHLINIVLKYVPKIDDGYNGQVNRFIYCFIICFVFFEVLN